MEQENMNFLKYQDWLKGEYREKFTAFCELLLSYNQKFNLTAITEKREIFYKHFLDSVVGESFFPKNVSVCEIGSGAGFPSIPLKIVRDDLRFVLVESTKKKCDFLRAAIEKLELANVAVYHARAEELGKEEHFREQFDCCCARAVAPMNSLCEYCLPFVKRGGTMIAYKGNVNEELAQSQRAIAVLGGGKEKTFSYRLPENMGEHTIVVIPKIKNTPAKYPRGRGKERSAPIV